MIRIRQGPIETGSSCVARHETRLICQIEQTVLLDTFFFYRLLVSTNATLFAFLSIAFFVAALRRRVDLMLHRRPIMIRAFNIMLTIIIINSRVVTLTIITNKIIVTLNSSSIRNSRRSKYLCRPDGS